jgi:hypothetical protein
MMMKFRLGNSWILLQESGQICPKWKKTWKTTKIVKKYIRIDIQALDFVDFSKQNVKNAKCFETLLKTTLFYTFFKKNNTFSHICCKKTTLFYISLDGKRVL